MKRFKRASLTTLYVTVVLVALGAVKKAHAPDVTVVHAIATARVQSAAGSVGGALFPRDPTDSEEPDRAAIRQRLRRDEQGTYISEILKQRDSSLARWPDRGDKPSPCGSSRHPTSMTGLLVIRTGSVKLSRNGRRSASRSASSS